MVHFIYNRRTVDDCGTDCTDNNSGSKVNSSGGGTGRKQEASNGTCPFDDGFGTNNNWIQQW